MSVIVSNNAFASPTVGVGNKLDITNVTDITNWTVSGFTNASVKLLNTIALSDAEAPYNWNDVPVKTVLYVAQTDVTTTDIIKSIDISNVVTHEISIWATNRKSSYNNSQSFSVLVDDNVIIGPITFTTGSTTTPWTKYTGNYTPSTTGSKTLKLRWNNSATNDSAIMVTSVLVKEPASFLKNLGYTATQMKNFGYTALELKSGGYDIKSIRDAGYTVKNLFDASYNESEILSSTSAVSATTNLSLWLDAKDPYGTGQTISSNTALSSWSDKSQYQNNASAVTVADVSTTISYNINGLKTSYPAFSFLASQTKRMIGQFATGSNITGSTLHIFSVVSLPNDNDVGFAGRVLGLTNTFKNKEFNNMESFVYGKYGSGAQGTGLLTTRGGAFQYNNPPSYGTPLIRHSWFDGTKAYSKYLNGNSSAQSDYNSAGNFNVNYFSVGGAAYYETNPAGYITANMSEILFYKGTLNSSDIEKVEGYLAWKWDLVSTLPSNHPYKTVNPNYTIPASEFVDAGYSALQLKNLYSIDIVKTFGFTVPQMRDAGYTALEMKTAGYTAAELYNNGVNGYTAAEMKSANYTASELKILGYTASQLRAVGYTASQSRGAGYTVSELLAASYTEAEILGSVGNIDFSSSDLRLWLDASDPSANGVRPTTNTSYSQWSDKSIYQNNATCKNTSGQVATRTVLATGFLGKYPAFDFDAGWGTNEFRFLGEFSSASKISGTTSTVFIVSNVGGGSPLALYNNLSQNPLTSVAGWLVGRAGTSAFNIAQRNGSADANNFFGSPSQNLYRYQFSGTHKSSSYLASNVNGFVDAVYSSTGSFNINNYAVGGSGATGSFFAGIISEILYFNSSLTDSEIKKVEGYLSWKWGLTELLPNNHPFKNALPISEFVAAGYTLAQLKNIYRIDTIKPLGYTVAQMREAGYTALEMKTAGYTATELYYSDNGYTATEMKTASYTATHLKSVGYTGAQLKTAGYTATEMKAANYTATELKAVNYTASEMKTATFTASELTVGGYTIEELKAGGYTATEMKTASYNATQLRGVGYTASEMKVAAFTASELTIGGYTGEQLKAAGYNAKNMKDAGYNVSQLKGLNYDVLQIKRGGFTLLEMLNGGFTNSEINSLLVNFLDSSNNELRLWLDAKDPLGNGTELSSNTTRSSWIDKSQYQNNTTALTMLGQSTNIEYQAAGFNSYYPTFNFTGNGDRFVGTLPTSNSSNISGNSMRVFIVGSLASDSPGYSRFIGFSTTYLQEDHTTSQTWGFLRAGNTGLAPWRNNSYVNNNPSGYNTSLIWDAWFDGTKAYANFLNGDSTATVSYNSTGNFDIRHFAIGNSTRVPQNTDGLKGKISEILVFNGTLTSIDVEKIEGYLAWKWGLQSTLPTDHLYKSSANPATVQELLDVSYNMTQIKAFNYTAANLKSESFQASQLLNVYTATEARIGGYSVSELIGGGYAKIDIIEAGFSVSNLRLDGGYSPNDLKNNYTSNQLLAGGYTAEQLASGTFTASEMRESGLSPKQLQDYGYPDSEILAAGYTATALKAALYKAADLRGAGYNISQIRGGGYSPSEALLGGFSKLEIAQGGYTVQQLRTAGIEATFLRQAGFTPQNLISVNYPSLDILGAGFTASQLRLAGYTIDRLKQANYSASSILGAGYSAELLFANGYTSVQDLRANNYTASAVRTAGYPDSNILSAGFSVSDLRDASFSALVLKNNSYTASQLVLGNYPRTDVLALDFSANDFRLAQFTSTELRTRGMTIADLTTGGYTDSQILSAGYSATLLKQSNYTAAQLMQNSYTISDLRSANYEANQIINAGYTTSVLRQNGYTAKQLMNNNFTISTLKAGLYTDSDILSAGFSAQSLRDASYNVVQLKDNNYDALSLKAAGYNSSDILSAGFSASDLQKASFTALELKNSNYSVDNLITAGYSSNDILDAGYTATQLRGATLRTFAASALRLKNYSVANLIQGGYSSTQIIGAGYSASQLFSFFTVTQLKDTYTPVQLKSGGFADNDILAASFTVTALKRAQFTASQLRLAGYTVSDLLAGTNVYSRSEVLAGGFSSSELKLANFTATELKQNGYSIQDLIDASYTDTQILTAGYSAADLLDMNYTASQLYSNNYTASQLKTAGYNDSDILGLGYSIQQLKTAGYLPADLQNDYSESEILSGGFTATSLKTAGYTISQLKTYNYTVQRLKEALYDDADILSSGYTPLELKQNGYTATNLYENNYTASELREAGYTVAELQGGGYSTEEILNAGYLASKLREGGYSSSALKGAAYSALELNAGGYSNEDVLSIGYTVKELTIGGYTVDQMKFYGYSDGTILTGLSTAIETLPEPPVITSIVTGDSIAYVHFTDLSNSTVPIIGYKYTLDGSAAQFWSKNDNSPLIILGLTNGTSYDIGIYAVNRNGTSVMSNLIENVIPSDVPSQPVILNGVSDNGVITFEYINSEVNGSEITEYYYSVDDVNYVLTEPSGNIISISGLDGNEIYNITLKTKNANGFSEKSNVLRIKNIGSMMVPVITDVSFNSSTGYVYYTIDSSLNKIFYKYSLNNSDYLYFSNQENPLIIDNLSLNGTYTIKIKAEHFIYGESSESNSVTFTTMSAPSTSTILSANYFNGTMSLEVIEGQENGSPLTNYYYSLNDSSYSYIGNIEDSVITIQQIIDTNISNSIKIKSENAIGLSEESNSAVLTYKILPDKPTINSVTAGENNCSINYTDGNVYNSPILCYKYKLSNDPTIYIAKQLVNPIIIDGLTNGTNYTVKIKTVCESGESEYSNISEVFMPFGVPSAPTITKVEPRVNSLLVSFQAGNNGGLEILGYKYSVSNGPLIEAPSTTSPMLIEGLINKSTFFITLYAYNTKGLSIQSNSEIGVPGVPTAPIINSVTASDSTFTINYTQSAINNGSAIIKMFYTFDNINILQFTSMANPLIIKGAANGRLYNIRILSSNTNGFSPVSNSVSAIINVPPSRLFINSASLFLESASTCYAVVNIKPPVTNGSPITKYKYALGTSNTYIDLPSTSLPLIIPNLPVNTSMTIKVVATNLYGDSQGSLPSKAVQYKLEVPTRPLVKGVTTSFNSMLINFVKPKVVGDDIRTYKYSLNNGPFVDMSSNALPFTVPILNNTQYNVQVIAANIFGDSLPSLPLAKTVSSIYLPPLAPKIDSIVGGNNSLMVYFTAPTIRGAPVTTYSYSLDPSSSVVSTQTSASPLVITGLTNGTNYRINLYANSLAGLSAASNLVSATPIYSVPGIPVITSIEPLNNSCSVTLGTPVTNGAPITTYLYSLDGGNTLLDSGRSTTKFLINGLVNGTSYSIRIVAVNAVGNSPLSLPTSVTPIYAVPSAPVITSVRTGVGSAQIIFTPSLPNGSAIKSYSYSFNNGVTIIDTTSISSPITITSLTSSFSYTIRLYAQNDLGYSTASNAMTFTVR